MTGDYSSLMVENIKKKKTPSILRVKNQMTPIKCFP